MNDMPDMPVFLVRLKTGVLESQRVVHIVPADQVARALVVPYCGIVLRTWAVDQLDGPQGAPCEACFRIAPIPGLEEAPPAPPALPKREPGETLRGLLHDLEAIAVEAITAPGSSSAQARVAAHNLELLH